MINFCFKELSRKCELIMQLLRYDSTCSWCFSEQISAEKKKKRPEQPSHALTL